MMKRVSNIPNLVVSLFLMSALLIVGVIYTYTLQTADAKAQSEVRVTQNIVGAENPVNTTYRGNIQSGMTALELLREQAQVEMKGEGATAYIIEINGRKADEANREFWALYVNGKQAEVGAGSYTLQQDDVVEWKIEHY